MFLIFFTNQPDRAMMHELGMFGHDYTDTPSQGVVRGYAAYFYDNVILIGRDIPQTEVEAIERDCHWIIRLTAETTAKDVVWELLNMFPPRNFTAQ